MSFQVEEDGDEVFIPFKDVRCWHNIDCGGAKLEVREHDNSASLHWRCPKCGGYYGEADSASGVSCHGESNAPPVVGTK